MRRGGVRVRSLGALTALAVTLTAGVTVARADADVEAAVEAIHAWDMAGARAAVRRLEAQRPSDGRTALLAGQLALHEGRYDDATQLLQRAVEAGAGELGAHYLEIARNTALETRGYAEHRTRDGHFVIRHEPGVDEVLVPYAEEVLEQAWRELTVLFGHVPEGPLRVEIYPRVETLGAVSPLTVKEIRTSGTIALCKYNRLMIVSPRDLVYGYEWADTLAHELIHLLITQKSRNRVPIWLHEGLAKYYEAKWKAGQKPKLGRPSEDLLARAVAADQLISFEAMSPSMAKLPSQEATATAFAEVFTVIEFLASRGGDQVAEALVRLMGEGKSDRDAVAEVAQLPWERFEPAWKQYLKQKGLRRLEGAADDKLLFRGADAEAAELEGIDGEQARKHTWLGDQLRLRERFKAAAKQYRKASAVAGDLNAVIQAKLGGALLKLGEVDQAIAELQRPLDVHDGYVLLHLHLGRARMLRSEWAAARVHFETALHINPFDRELHGHLAKVYEQLDLPDLAARERRAHRLVNGE